MFAIVIGIWRAGGVACTSYAEDTKGYKLASILVLVDTTVVTMYHLLRI